MLTPPAIGLFDTSLNLAVGKLLSQFNTSVCMNETKCVMLFSKEASKDESSFQRQAKTLASDYPSHFKTIFSIFQNLCEFAHVKLAEMKHLFDHPH
jgi:hypothetical protein